MSEVDKIRAAAIRYGEAIKEAKDNRNLTRERALNGDQTALMCLGEAEAKYRAVCEEAEKKYFEEIGVAQ